MLKTTGMIGHMSEKTRFKFAENAESYGGKRKKYAPAQKRQIVNPDQEETLLVLAGLEE